MQAVFSLVALEKGPKEEGLRVSEVQSECSLACHRFQISSCTVLG